MVDLARIKANAQARVGPRLVAIPAIRLLENQLEACNQNSQIATIATSQQPDVDRWCWPRSDAMNSTEMETMASRVRLFVRRGIGDDHAERLADMLVVRDRNDDDRRLCLECRRLTGPRGSRRCTDSAAAGLHRDLPDDLTVTLQRCPAFKAQGSNE